MPWKDDEFSRPRSELLDGARRRGEQLRRRRRLAWVLTTPVVLLAVAIPAALAVNGSREGRTIVASRSAGAATTTTPALAPSTEDPTPSTAPPTSVDGPAPSTTTARTPPAPGVATTVPATTTTTIPGCDRSAFTLSPAKADKPSYKVGELTRIDATLSYNNTRTCTYPRLTSSARVLDRTGREVGITASHDDYFGRSPTITPGQTENVGYTWSNFFDGAPAPPGTYTAILSADGLVSAPITFQIVAG